MSSKEWAAFSLLAALVFPAFAPVELLSGKIIAAAGFLAFGALAAWLFVRSEAP